MSSTSDLIESMRVHRRFTQVGGGGLRGDSNGMWTTYRHLEERVAAERARIREELRAGIAAWMTMSGANVCVDERSMGARAAMAVVVDLLGQVVPEVKG